MRALMYAMLAIVAIAPTAKPAPLPEPVSRSFSQEFDNNGRLRPISRGAGDTVDEETDRQLGQNFVKCFICRQATIRLKKSKQP